MPSGEQRSDKHDHFVMFSYYYLFNLFDKQGGYIISTVHLVVVRNFKRYIIFIHLNCNTSGFIFIFYKRL